MEKQDIKYIVGIEIGSSRAKIGLGGYTVNDKGEPTGPLTVYDIRSCPTVDAVRYGRITNVKEVTEALERLVENLENRPPVLDRKIRSVYIGVGGRSLRSSLMASCIVLPDRREITEDLIERLKDDVASKVASGREILAIEAVRFTVDNILTPRPVGTLGSRLAGEFTVVTCDPSNVKDFREVLLDRMGLGVCGSAVRPVAIANLVLSPSDAFSGCMLVDFGAETITVSIYKGGSLRYLATIPLGSRLLTRDLSAMLGLPEDEAEDVKLRLGTALSESDGTDSRQMAVDSIISARLNDLIANIGAQPGFAGLGPDDLGAGIILTGGGSKLRNFSRTLESAVGLKVRMATVPSEIVIADSGIVPVDNVDMIALLNEAAFESRKPEVPECLTPPIQMRQPVSDTPAVKIEKRGSVKDTADDLYIPDRKDNKKGSEPKSDDSFVIDDWDHPGYEPHNGFDESDDENLLEDDPGLDYYEEYNEKEDDLILLDDDKEAAKRRKQRKEQQREAERQRFEAEKERKRREREEKKREEAERKSKIPSRLDIFISKVANFVGKTTNDDEDGPDLDD